MTFAPTIRNRFDGFGSRGMAEWSIAAVLKTVVGQPTGGSNPSPSAEQLATALRRG